MISILIPTYNYNVYPLVERLHSQASEQLNSFEIKVYDDCSTQPPSENEQINTLEFASYTELDKNIGRSAIRNKLAHDASFDTLLFLDADTQVIRDDFVSSYLKATKDDSEIIYGGILYQEEPPREEELLRWVYGNKREALSVEERRLAPHLRFLTLNFLIKKAVFKKLRFNEEIPNLRHEDTLFALDAKKKGIRVAHIDNPVVHLGLESSEVFLRKSNESVEALRLFVTEGLINAEDTKLSKKANSLRKQGLAGLLRSFYLMFKKMMERNLLSRRPSLFIFDMYRLGYYLQLTKR